MSASSPARIVSMLLLSCVVPGCLSAQVVRDGDAPGKDPAVTADYDIRVLQGRQETGLAPAEAVVQERKEASEAFLTLSQPQGRPGARIALNGHGLPKSFFDERGPLSPPSQREPEGTAKAFLRDHDGLFPFTASDLDGLRLVSRDSADGGVFLTFNQTLDGIRVFHGQVRIALNGAGQVVHAGVGEVIPGLRLVTNPRLSPEDAVNAAYRGLRLEPPARLETLSSSNHRTVYRNPQGSGWSDITAELYIFPMTAVSARLAYRVLLEAGPGKWFEILIDAEDARTLFRYNLYRSAAQGNVWKESPQKAPRELVTFPDSWIAVTSPVTRGNNTDAFLDRDGDLNPDTASIAGLQNGRAFSASQIFDFPAGEGSTGQNPRNFAAAAVTNAFYLVNTAHDYYYTLGFMETSGNFQTDNLGRGGAGNDAVLTHVQFGDDFGAFDNNSAFGTPPDGTPPRMLLGLFTRNTTIETDDLDAAYDGQVILHEYGHGVTTRIVGKGTDVSCLGGPQSGALGEGWSDYFGASFYNNPAFGSYVAQNTVTGIRRQNYEGYTFTYEDLGNARYEVHRDGEIWAAALWDLRKALGQAVTDRLVVNGLRFTPCNPSMIDARDGILMADQTSNSGANRAKIWQVFARHGMGFSAAGEDGASVLGFMRRTIHTAAFDQPADLQAGNRVPRVTSRPPRAFSFSSLYIYTVTVEDPDGGQIQYQLLQGPPGMTVDPATGLIRWVATFEGARVKVAITDGQGGRVIHSFFTEIDTPLTVDAPIIIQGTERGGGFANVLVPAGSPVLQVKLRGGSGDPDIVVLDPDGKSAGSISRVGTPDTLSISAPRAGRWAILVPGFKDYSGVSLTASLPAPALLSGNTTRNDLSGEVSSEVFYRVVVPPNATSLQISTRGGSGDVDVFVRRGQVPACQVVRVDAIRTKFISGSGCGDSSLRSLATSSSENVSISNPEAGDWYIDLTAALDYSGATLSTMLTAPPTLVLGASALAFSAVEGRAAPSPQSLNIANTSGASFSWTAQATTTPAANWLKLSHTSGTGDGAIAVSIDLTGLTAGTYRGSIVVSAAGLGGSPQTASVTLTVAARPVIALGASSLSFSALPGRDPAAQSLTISNAGGSTLEWSAAVSSSSGGSWLSVSPASGSGNATLQVSVRSANLAPAVYTGTIAFGAPGAGNSPASVIVQLTIALPVLLTSEGIVNAGSFARNRPLAVNEIVSLFGGNFTDPCSLAAGDPRPCPSAAGFPLPTQLGSTRVTINGISAPLLLVTPSQINFVTPFGLTGPTATIVVTRGPVVSAPVTLPLADQSLGVFTVLSNGAGAGIVLHADGRLVTRNAPIEPDEVVIIYGTGFGAVDPVISSGQPAPSSPLSETRTPVRVIFDGGEGRVLFSGPAPGFAGLYQMNVQAPSFLARRYPVVSLQSAVSRSNDISAGGPGVLDVTPSTAQRGADLTVTVRGVNFSPASELRIAGENIGVSFQDGPLQALTATVPGRLLNQAGDASVVVVDPLAPGEEPSNAVRITVTAGQ